MVVVHDARVTDAACKETLMPSFFVYRHSGRGAIKNIIKNTYMGCCMTFSERGIGCSTSDSEGCYHA